MTAAFALAFRELERTYPERSDLLRILAFLDPESVSIDMLKKGCSKREEPSTDMVVPDSGDLNSKHVEHGQESAKKELKDDLEHVRKLLGSSVGLQMALQYLQRLSLVVQRKDGGVATLWLHDLVQLLIRKKLMNESERNKWLQHAVYITSQAFDEIDEPGMLQYWTESNKFVAHAQALQRHAEKRGLKNEKLLNVGSKIALYLSACGRWEEALKTYEIVFRGRRELLGAEHPDTLKSMGDLASSFSDRRQLKEAEELYMQLIKIRKRLLGEEHSETLTCLNNLAAVFWEQERLTEAEEIHIQVLKVQKRILAEEDPATISSLSNLGTSLLYLCLSNDAEDFLMHLI